MYTSPDPFSYGIAHLVEKDWGEWRRRTTTSQKVVQFGLVGAAIVGLGALIASHPSRTKVPEVKPSTMTRGTYR